MKRYLLFPVVLLSGCITIEMPGVVTDTVKVGKDTYSALVEKKPVPDPTVATEEIVNSHVGKETQTVAELKRLCVGEVVDKLTRSSGKTPNYRVEETRIVTIGDSAVATCRISVTR